MDCHFDIFFLEAILNGLLLAGLLALLALGLNLVFGVIDVVWICYAELVMVGMYGINHAYKGGAPFLIAALVALGAPSRPSVYLYATPERSPWVTADAIRSKGAIVLWPTADTAGTPPPAIRARFPDLVPEVPRAFERSVQGRLPLLRIGWGVIRPQAGQPTTQDSGQKTNP